jgi:hypothetical protein
MGGLSERTLERLPGQLRFKVTVGRLSPSLVERIEDYFRPYDYETEINCLSQCLAEVNHPGWRPSTELVERGFVMKQS